MLRDWHYGCFVNDHERVNCDQFNVTPSGAFEADGLTDPGVYEEATANWFVTETSAGVFTPYAELWRTGCVPVLPQVTILRVLGLL